MSAGTASASGPTTASYRTSIGASRRSREGDRTMRLRFSLALCASVLAALAVVSAQGQSQRPERPNDGQESFRFKSGVELINVTATVTDANGRFVPGLRQDDFVIYEDNEPQQITHFSSERVPVSLGIALDTSSSMMGEKIESTRRTRSFSISSATTRICCRVGLPTGRNCRARSTGRRRTVALQCTTPCPK